MVLHQTRWRGHLVRRWTCCGHVWELLPVRWRPGDQSWHPVCPTCGGTISAAARARCGWGQLETVG
jgi:hypothetical protein